MQKGFKAIILGLILFFSSALPSFASVESIESFNTQITVHKDGSLDVVENIKYDFSTNQKHGIYRNIPLVSSNNGVYKEIGVDLKEVLRDGIEERYAKTTSNNNLSLKIGKADQTISGIHNYTISYKVTNVIGNFDDHDEIYWNATGTDWEAGINSASVKVIPDFNISITKFTCFTGDLSSKDRNCEFNKEGEAGIFKSTAVLNNREGLTIVAGFPPNTFPKSTIRVSENKELSPFWTAVIIGLVILVSVLYYIVLPFFVFRWYLKSRHKSRFGSPSVNFDLPKDNNKNRLLPAEAGVMDTARLEKDDVIATIFDLAIRKYIFIEQIKKKKFLGLGEDKDFLIKKKKDFNDLTEFEKTLLERLFKNGDSVELGSLSSDFYETFTNLQKNIFSLLINKGFYKENPQNKKALYAGLGFFSVVFFLNLPLAFILFWMFGEYNGRTDLGDEADFRIDGLKLFLKSMDREHKWYANQLALVEQMIPYSIALGYIDKFMEQLKISYPDYDPAWYKGNLAFYSVSNSMFRSMNSGFTTNAPSKSSGFSSGGGFSGGGSGGGGGGSW